MDDFIRRQYTYRRVLPNPLLKVERVWTEVVHNKDSEYEEADDSDLGDVEEVEKQTLIPYPSLSLVDKLNVLHNLCEWHLQSDKFRERIGANTDLQMSLWRLLPIGSDRYDQLYYFLDDGRLYRCQNPANRISTNRWNHKHSKKRKRASGNPENSTASIKAADRDDWTCVATTYDQWLMVLEEFSDPISDEEEQLRAYLQEEALPIILEEEEKRRAKEAAMKAKAEKADAERAKELMRQELLATRKRSSRIASLDEKRELERKRMDEIKQAEIMELKAKALVQEEQQTILAAPKTREARARERELRDYMSHKTPTSVSESVSPQVDGDAPPKPALAYHHPEVAITPQDAHWLNEKIMENAPVTNGDFEQKLLDSSAPSKSTSTSISVDQGIAERSAHIPEVSGLNYTAEEEIISRSASTMADRYQPDIANGPATINTDQLPRGNEVEVKQELSTTSAPHGYEMH